MDFWNAKSCLRVFLQPYSQILSELFFLFLTIPISASPFCIYPVSAFCWWHETLNKFLCLLWLFLFAFFLWYFCKLYVLQFVISLWNFFTYSITRDFFITFNPRFHPFYLYYLCNISSSLGISVSTTAMSHLSMSSLKWEYISFIFLNQLLHFIVRFIF